MSSSSLHPPALRSDFASLRAEFPGLQGQVHGHPLVYLDSASTTQKPQAVLRALHAAYVDQCANIHRGVHSRSQQASATYEAVREKVRRFLHAPQAAEVVFTRGTTESLNLLAYTLGSTRLGPGDEVVVSGSEHHSNIVPWQRQCTDRRAALRVLPLLPDGRIDLDRVAQVLGPRTQVVAISHAGNALGHVVPLVPLIAQVRRHAPQAVVVVDGAQAVPHLAVDVQALDCDFYCFSAHKLYGPTGAGVLWGRRALLDALPPWQSGGDMVLSVRFEETQYQDTPHKFEAGTPAISEVIGLGAALDFLANWDLAGLSAHEAALRAHGVDLLQRIDGVRVLGGPASPGSHVPVLSFVVPGVHPHDLGTALDYAGVAVRTGHHCAQPLMAHLGIAGTVRASLGCYSSADDLQALADALDQSLRLFRRRR